MCAGLTSDWQRAFLSCRQSFRKQDKLCLSCIECLGLCRWEASRMLAGWQGQVTLLSGKEMWGVPGVALTYCCITPKFFSSAASLEITNVLIKDLLLCTETQRPAQIESETLITFLLQNFHWFCMRSRSWEPPCRIQCKLISRWSTVSSFLTQVLGELFIVPSLQSLLLLLLSVC